MLAAYANAINPDDPLAGLIVGQVADPEPPQGWVKVTLKAAALNHHDLWTLQGVGISPDRLPMILGCDGAGITPDGSEVIIHCVIGDPAAGRGDETLDPKRSLLSEIHNGTLAGQVIVPERNLVPKPAFLSWAEAACLPTAWLTAYRMLFHDTGLKFGDTVLVQGAGGGVATAAVQIARAAGFRVWVTSRDPAKAAKSLAIGAEAIFESGEKLPEKVDCVIETVGRATWSHSLRSLRPGGTVVVSGATSGADPPADLNRVFFLQLRIIGSTMGSKDQLEELVGFVDESGIRPVIDSTYSLAETAEGLRHLASGAAFGKVVIVP